MNKALSLVITILVAICACKSSEKLTKKPSRLNLDLLYKAWDVDSIVVGEKIAIGFEMGEPQYEFTRNGQRIKSFKTPPNKDSVGFFIINDSIHYKSEKPLPSSAIAILNDSTLVLKNEKAIWYLYIKK
jgi:hypothetical protein